MGNWVTISASGTGSFTPPPAAPNIVDDGTTVASVFWEPYGHDWKRGFTGTLHLPTTDANYSHLAEVDIVATEAGGKTIPVTSLRSTQFSGTTITFETDTFPVVFPFTTEVWTLKFRCVNDANKATATPTFRTVTVTAPVVNSTTAAETGPRIQTPLSNGQPGGAIGTTVTVTPVLSFNPGGGSAKQYVTIWTSYDWGGGLGTKVTWKGWYIVTGTTSAITLDKDNLVFVTTLASTTVTVKVAIGAVDGNAPIPAGAAVGTFTMAGPALAAPASTITAASVLGIKYSRKPGGFQWAWTGFQMTCPLVTTGPITFDSSLFFGRFYLAKGAWNPGTQTWSPDPNYVEWPVGDTEDGTESISTNTVTTIASPPQDFPAPADPFPTFRIRILAFTRKDGDTGTLQNSWTGSEPAGVVNATAGSAVYITPDVTKASLSAADIDLNTIGDRLGISGGKLNVSTPLAPPPISVTAVIFATSFGIGDPHYLAPIILPVWNAVLTITLNTGHVNYPHTKQLSIQIPGYSDFTVTSWTLAGAVTTVTIPPELQNTSTGGPTVSVFSINEDGQPSATAATVVISVPATASPITGAAPLAPSFAGVTATAPVFYNTYGRDYSVGFIPDFIAPANPGGGAYDVQVSKIYPTGGRATISTMHWGPFVVGTHYSFTTEAVDRIIPGNWIIEFAPINPDQIVSAVKQVTVAVAPNVITGVSGVEGTPYINSGLGGQTHVIVTPSITSVNAPGLSLAVPQYITVYFSADSGATWFWLGLPPVASSGQALSFEVWRPTDSSKTCKVAAVIGGFDGVGGTFRTETPTGPIPNASLPSGNFQSATFTLNVIGAPIATGVTSAFVVARTATGGAAYNSVTLEKSGEGVAAFGLPDGIQWTNPLATTDPNFANSQLEVSFINVSGTPAPPEQQGVPTMHNGPLNDQPGATTITKDVDGWTFQPAGSTFTRLRLKVFCYSRSGQRTQQTTCWGGADHFDVFFGDAPSSAILATVAFTNSMFGPGINVSGGKPQINVAGAASELLTDPGFESGSFSAYATSGAAMQTVAPHSGTFHIGIAPSFGFAQQAAAAVAGQAYSCSVWMESFGCDRTAYFYVRFYSGAGGTGSLLPSGGNFFTSGNFNNFVGGYQSGSSGTVTAPSGTQSIMLGVQVNSGGSAGQWFFDDFSILPATSAGGGLSFTVANALKINPSTTVGVDGGNNLAVLNASLGLAQFGGAYQPYAFYAGLPFIDSTTPKIIINTAVSPWKIYRQNGFGGWTKDVDPADFVAGTITALVQIISPTISGGTITGATLLLQSGGLTTSLNNNVDGGVGAPVGFRTQDNSLGYYSTHRPQGVDTLDQFGNGCASLLTLPISGGVNRGRLFLHRTDNLSTITLDSATGTLLIQSSGGVIAGVTLGDGSNTMQITASGITRNGVGLVFP